jgi:uncharacterized protein
MTDYLALLDWRRRVAELFVELRRRPPDVETLGWFRGEKDELFRAHPESPLPADERAGFTTLHYWPFDPGARVVARLLPTPDEEAPAPIETSTGAELAFSQIGWLDFRYAGQDCRLGAYWIHGYAGGLFVPFRDGTSGRETYGGGRYLLDTIKSADFGSDADSGSVVLDFNYAYHPSCFYHPKWTCPLAPPDNWLAIPIRAGERAAPTEETT